VQILDHEISADDAKCLFGLGSQVRMRLEFSALFSRKTLAFPGYPFGDCCRYLQTHPCFATVSGDDHGDWVLSGGLRGQHAGVCPAFHVGGSAAVQWRRDNGVAFAGLIPMGSADEGQEMNGMEKTDADGNIYIDSEWRSSDLNGANMRMPSDSADPVKVTNWSAYI
jgi:hypothetical protein